MRPTRPTAAWAAAICSATLVAAGAVAAPTAFAADSTDPVILRVAPVPTEVLASAQELEHLGTVVDAHLAGDNVFVEVSTAAGRRVYWRPVAGSGSWSNAWGGRTLTGNLLASENDVLLLDVGSTDVLAWSRDGGGSRTVPEGAVLGQGAQYVAYIKADAVGGPRPVTQGVTGGEQVRIQYTNSDFPSLPRIENGYAITENWFYAVDEVLEEPDWYLPLRRWNATTGYSTWPGGDPCGAVPGASDPHVEDARGRFALVSCTDGVVGLTLDSARVYDEVTLGIRMKRTVTPPRLGDGFALGVSTVTGELLAAPYLGGTPGTLGAVRAFDLDDPGTRVVLVDAARNVRIARDLRSWSSTPSPEIVDNAPPGDPSVSVVEHVPYRPGTARITANASGGRDYATPPFLASGLAGQELRYRIRPGGDQQFSDWRPVPDGEVTEYPAPSRICWTGRNIDRAGNVSAWAEEICRDTVDTTNQVEPYDTPAAVLAADGGNATVQYVYGGVDGQALITVDVRYRWFVPRETPPDWTVRQASGGRMATFLLQDVPAGHNVCFQARGYDDDDSVSEWMAERCTYVDGEAPTITSTSYPRWVKPSQTRVVNGVRTAEPQFTWTAEDDFGIEDYSVQRSLTPGGAGAGETVPVSGTSYARTLTEAGQHCLRVQAKDLVGNQGPWSDRRCSTMPVSAARLDGMSFSPYHHRVRSGSGDLVTTHRSSAVEIRAKVDTGPRFGRMKVYVGSRYLGTVNARASEPGKRWVSLSRGERLEGKVRFVAFRGEYVDLREFYIVR